MTQEVKPQDHPDFIGGWVWTELEISWIQNSIAEATLNERKKWSEVEAYLIAASDGSMSRNNSEALAGELLSAIKDTKEQAAQRIPDWLTYDPQQDVLTIHGKRYSGAMFGETGLLSPPGTLLRIEKNDQETIVATTVTYTDEEPDYWLGYGSRVYTEKPFENATALYRHPPQRTEQEPVGATLSCASQSIYPGFFTSIFRSSYPIPEGTKLYITPPAQPPQRTWVGLTDEDRLRLWIRTESEDVDRYAFAKAIEAKLKEKNT
jgi:hypothetical protein